MMTNINPKTPFDTLTNKNETIKLSPIKPDTTTYYVIHVCIRSDTFIRITLLLHTMSLCIGRQL